MLIQAFNPDISQYERTSLSTPVAAGATALPVKNSNLIVNTDRVLVGAMARERSEIVSVTSSPTSTNIPVGALTQSHNTDDPVYKMRFDQVRFYRSTTGVAGTYTLLGTLPMDVDNADSSTYWDDATGLSSYFYKTSYYNSVSATESLLSDPIPGSGFSRKTVGAVLQEVAYEIGDENFQAVTRGEWLSWFNETNDDLMLKGKRPYIFQIKTVAVDVTAGSDIPYPSDLLKFDRLDYTYAIGGTTQTYAVRDIPVEQMLSLRNSSAQIASDYLQYVALDDSTQTIQVYPKFATSRTGVVSLRYYAPLTDITSDSQVLQTPNPLIYKMHLLARFFLKKGQQDPTWLNVANTYLNNYNTEVLKLQKNQMRDVGSPRSFSFGNQDGGRQYTSGYRRF